ncbi:MAG: DUF885 domain-containing protein [Lysobacteraceae bacterium]|nr:MAG: DUF885 domain-containing protein [Xanthomonadaceae bacterium]
MPDCTRPLPLSLCIATALATLLMAGCVSAPVSSPSLSAASVSSQPARQAESVTDYFASFTDQWMRRQPSAATASRYFDGAEQDAMDRQITPETDAFEQETVALARQGLAGLAAFDRASISDTERVSAELMRWQLQMIVDGERHAGTQFPLNQFRGANVNLPNLMTVIHPVGSARDAENYLARLRLFDPRMNEATRAARERADQGILPPRFILQATIAQMQQFIAPEPASNPLVTTLGEKLASVAAVDAAARQRLLDEAARIVQASVYPAWRTAIAELQAQLPRATDDAGLWRFANGAQAYAHRLRQFTSTALSAEDIHAIGLSEVARIETEMDSILRSIGRTEGSVTSRIDQLQAELAYPDTDAGRSQIMADIETMIRDAEVRADALFDIRPKSAVIARPYPEYRWASAAASYTAPPLDGSRPGVYQMPLRKDRLSRFGLRTLVYHETVPGHHFQVALSVENKAVPAFRQVRAFGGISAFSEGWALYAERIAKEENWYEGDPEGLLGQLDAELFRARRLVVDTGLHAKRWTRQQAIDYGIPPSEVERYVVIPGQATSYKIGQLEIIRLRDEARAALGEKFNPRQFHNLLLLTGTVPLELLDQEVAAWTVSQR